MEFYHLIILKLLQSKTWPWTWIELVNNFIATYCRKDKVLQEFVSQIAGFFLHLSDRAESPIFHDKDPTKK